MSLMRKYMKYNGKHIKLSKLARKRDEYWLEKHKQQIDFYERECNKMERIIFEYLGMGSGEENA